MTGKEERESADGGGSALLLGQGVGIQVRRVAPPRWVGADTARAAEELGRRYGALLSGCLAGLSWPVALAAAV